MAATRAFWESLGLPGLFDVHVHFLPPNIQRAVWAQFDQAGPKIGRAWPIRYRQSVEERIALLRDLGVRRFSALPYAHKPGVATYLNDWARTFAREVPENLWSATFFPEPEAAEYVGELVDAGVEVFKVHVQVGAFALDDRCSTACGRGWRRAGRRSWCTPDPAPCRTPSPGPSRWSAC